jgi:hypothetical protein
VLTQGEHLRVGHTTAVLGDEHQMGVQVAGEAVTASSVGVWFR